MRSPVLYSTVRTSSSGPSSAYAALSFTCRPVPWYVLPDSEPTKVGISTSESRGRETRVAPLSPVCRIIIESVRLPSAEPVCRSFFSSSDMPSRLSEPTIR
ncbi:hypothetical protein SFUMM280S_00382 [Streptomyces fumanus]